MIRALVAIAITTALACAAVSYSASTRPAPCAMLDLGDVVLCADRVVGVEPDGTGGAVVTSALDGVRVEWATAADLETVARRLRGVR